MCQRTRLDGPDVTGDASLGEDADWWRAWADVIVTPVDELVLVENRSCVLVTLPARSARVLDDLQTLCCSGKVRLGDLVAELRAAGFPSASDLESLVTNTALALSAAELVTLDRRPSPVPPPPPAWYPRDRPARHIPQAADAVRPFAPIEPVRPLDERLLPRPRAAELRTGTITVQSCYGTTQLSVGVDLDDVAEWFAGLTSFEGGPVDDFDLVVVHLPGSTIGGIVVADGICRYAPDLTGLLETIVSMIAFLAGVEPTDATRIPDCWVEPTGPGARLIPESQESVVPDTAAWCGPLWVSDDATTLLSPDSPSIAQYLEGRSDQFDVTTWHRRPLTTLDVPIVDGNRAVLAAVTSDLLRRCQSGHDHAVLEIAMRLAMKDRIVGQPPRPQTPPDLELPSAVTALQAVGALTAQAHSAKVTSGRLEQGRASWRFEFDDASDPDWSQTASRLLTRLSLPEHLARSIVELVGHRGCFVIGVEPETERGTLRTKVYLEIDSSEMWTSLTDLLPELHDLHEASLLSPGHAPKLPPQFVAWKRDNDKSGVSIYRRDHVESVTVADAISLVLPGRPEWRNSVRSLIGTDRPLDALLTQDDLEVIDPSGRVSVDLGVPSLTTRGNRIAPARWLAALAGIDDQEAHEWATRLAKSVVFRMIVGTDGTGMPFFSVYTV